jgi:hypothetical protein
LKGRSGSERLVVPILGESAQAIPFMMLELWGSAVRPTDSERVFKCSGARS